MSFRVVDLQCRTCERIVLDQTCPRESTPPCTCGGETYVYWGSRQLYRDRKADAFVPVTAGFKTYSTREEWNSYLKTMRRQTGDADFEVEGVSRKGRQQQLEEHVATTLEDYKRDGRDVRGAERRMEQYLRRGAR